MKIRMLALAAAAALASAVTPVVAQADWEPTQWGMTVEQVMHVIPAASQKPIGEAFSLAGYSDAKIPASNAYLYTRIDRQNRTYDVRIGFSNDRLKSVEFALVNATEQSCADARNDLQHRFGTPASGGSGEGGRYDSWNGDKDQVVFIYRTEPAPRCMILYSPIRQPDTGSAAKPQAVASL